MSALIADLGNGKQLRRLTETTWNGGAIRGIGDHGRHTIADATGLLADENVPVIGITEGWIGSARLAVDFPEARRARIGAEVTHLLEAESVPLIPPARKRGRAADESTSLAGSRFAHAADAEDDEDGEAGEDEADEGAEDPETHLTEFIESVAADAALTSKALRMLAQAFRQRKATSAAVGAFG